MKVSELIEKLKEFDSEDEVIFVTPDHDDYGTMRFRRCFIENIPNNRFRGVGIHLKESYEDFG